MEVFLFAEEFSKMKDEVPPALIGAHVKMVGQAVKDGKSVDDHFSLDKSGIAGTGKLMFSWRSRLNRIVDLLKEVP